VAERYLASPMCRVPLMAVSGTHIIVDSEKKPVKILCDKATRVYNPLIID